MGLHHGRGFLLDLPASAAQGARYDMLVAHKSTRGFRGYGFGPDEQPSTVLEWEPLGTATRYTVTQRGKLEPTRRFTILRTGQRVSYDTAPHHWMEQIGPRI